jgi:hypothetical protein
MGMGHVSARYAFGSLYAPQNDWSYRLLSKYMYRAYISSAPCTDATRPHILPYTSPHVEGSLHAQPVYAALLVEADGLLHAKPVRAALSKVAAYPQCMTAPCLCLLLMHAPGCARESRGGKGDETHRSGAICSIVPSGICRVDGPLHAQPVYAALLVAATSRCERPLLVHKIRIHWAPCKIVSRATWDTSCLQRSPFKRGSQQCKLASRPHAAFVSIDLWPCLSPCHLDCAVSHASSHIGPKSSSYTLVAGRALSHPRSRAPTPTRAAASRRCEPGLARCCFFPKLFVPTLRGISQLCWWPLRQTAVDLVAGRAHSRSR